jgi:hypothetical protein
MDRKRGAQPANKNAFKHGFYSEQFKVEECLALENLSVTDLSGEIEFVRVYLKRFMDAQNNLPQPVDFEAQLSVLRAITFSAESINSMVRTQIVLAQAKGVSDEIIRNLLQLSADDEKGDRETSLPAD